MSRRLCVVGNSHIAALKLAFDRARDAGGSVLESAEITFFGAPRDGLRHVTQEDGVIHPGRKGVRENFLRISGGMDQIRLADFDAFLLVGLNVSIKRLLRFYLTHAWPQLSGRAGKVVVHPRFAQEFLAERYADTLMVDLAAKIRSAVDRPVFAVAEPHWSAAARHAAKGPNYGWDAAISAGDAPALAQAFLGAVTQALQPHVQFLPQPPETVEASILTRDEFNSGASKLITGDGGQTDASHMNAAYGTAVWSSVAAALAI